MTRHQPRPPEPHKTVEPPPDSHDPARWNNPDDAIMIADSFERREKPTRDELEWLGDLTELDDGTRGDE